MKKFFSILFILVLIFTLSACEMDMQDPEKTPEGSDTIIKDVTLNYDSSKISENLQNISKENGILIELKIKIGYGENLVDKTMIYAQKDKLFYFLIEEEEIYMDLSDDEKAVVYKKNIAVESWDIKTYIYSEIENSKELIEEEYNININKVLRYLGKYDVYQGEKMDKTTDVVLGRECDKYTNNVNLLNKVDVKYTFSIDKVTGVCLKWEVSMDELEVDYTDSIIQSFISSFECIRFETQYSLSLPE